MGLGQCCHTQDTPQRERPVQYLSRQLTHAEQNYATIEKVLAVKWAVEILCYYLWGAPFSILMGHAPFIK